MNHVGDRLWGPVRLVSVSRRRVISSLGSLVAGEKTNPEPMIAVGTRIDRPSLDYDLLQVFRILLRHVPSAFVRSSKSADEAAAQRARALVNAGIDGPLTVEQVAGMERRKIEQWGGVVIDVRMRGNDLAFIGLIGTRHLVIRVDENIIGRETVHAIVDDLRAAGYPEVAVQ